MAYTKTQWVNDQAPDIDADNLNKMEEGIANAQYPDGGEAGQLLAKTASGQAWVDAPNSAVWGGITGRLSDQTDLANALANTGKVETVNGFSPDANKNVQVSESITEAGYEALSTTEKNSEREYFVSDGDVPYATGEDIPVSSTDSTPVSDAIEDLKSGLTSLFKIVTVDFNDTSISANALFSVSKNFTVDEAYRPIAISSYNLSRMNGFFITNIAWGRNFVTVGGHNNSTATSFHGSVTVLCARTNTVS